MPDLAIRVEHLSKQYRLGQREPYKSLREVLARAAAAPFRRLRLPGARPEERGKGRGEGTFWALDDISFEVRQGEAVGIIGRNGAGKSTLLKILSRITKPTRGTADLYGRVGSLLEVGTGFHPELSGRENIYLNGAILGMRRQEVSRKFDEIVAFAEIEKFLDTPVKRYSSGMYVRLAFAVAAHLEPEILLVDEVLAVGDAAFQKKCLGKMGEVAQGGRTVLFVSHSMPMILRLCGRAVLLEGGRIAAIGDVKAVTQYYLGMGRQSPSEKVWQSVEVAPGDSVAKLKSVRVKNRYNEVVEVIDIREPFFVEVEYWNLQNHLRPSAIVQITNEDGTALFASVDFNNKTWWNTPRQRGIVTAACQIPGNFMAEGRFFVMAAVGSYNPNVIHVREDDIVTFQVIDPSEGDGARGVYAGGNHPGVVRPLLEWTVRQTPQPNGN